MKTLKEVIIEKLKIGKTSFMLEKLKINSKSKIQNLTDLDDFVDYIENKTPFGKPLTKTKDKIFKGKFYNILTFEDNKAIYLFPLYITVDEEHCLGIYLIYEIDDRFNRCTLGYSIGATNKTHYLHLDKSVSNKKIVDLNDNIDFDKYLDIIIKLYNASKRMNNNPNEFLNKYEKIIDERS